MERRRVSTERVREYLSVERGRREVKINRDGGRGERLMDRKIPI